MKLCGLFGSLSDGLHLDESRCWGGLGFVFVLEADGTCRYDGGNGVFVNHLGDGSVSQEDDVLVERFDLTLQFDAVNQINRNRNVLFTQCVQEGILQHLSFSCHIF